MEDMIVVKTKEDFEKAWEYIKAKAQEIFEADKCHTHVIFVITKKGDCLTVSFDRLMDEAMPLCKAALEAGGVEGIVLQHAKDAVFSYVSVIMKQAEAVGYFQVCEGWSFELPESIKDPEKAVERLRELTKHSKDGSLEHVVGRFEMLTVTGRFRDLYAQMVWKVGRRDGEVWLKDGNEFRDTRADKVSRQAGFDRAIDAVLKEEEGAKHEEETLP